MASNKLRPTVLITGASSGIGGELVPFFAGTGHDVVLVGRQKPVLEGIAAAVRHVFGVKATAIACDLSEPDAAPFLFNELLQRGLKVDVLVNNAGFGASDELAATESDEHTIQTSITSLTALTNLLLPRMVARGQGRILNVASSEGFAPIPLHRAYRAAKASILRFSDRLAEEVKNTGVTVTTLCPDLIEAEPAAHVRFEISPEDQRQAISARSAARTGFRALIRGERMATPAWEHLAMATPLT